MKSILIVEDDITYGMMLKTWLGKKGFRVNSVSSIARAQKHIESENVDLILSDLRLPDRDGIDLLKWLGEHSLRIPLIIMTGYADIQSAVQAMKLGACDYIAKPVNPDELLKKMDDAFLPSGLPVSSTPAMRAEAGSNSLREEAESASSDYLEGESDAIDCGSIPKELAASEFFGHVKGSFTGALTDKTGAFVAANGGTIFLDEIGNLSYEVQIQLLRALQERKVRPIGSNKEIQVDVRLVSATNENLEQAIEKGTFREDLYHRINEFTLRMPQLKDRREDILLFANFFLDQANRELDKHLIGFDEKASKALLEYQWPGNLRQMKNIIRRATLLAQSKLITLDELSELRNQTIQPTGMPLRNEEAEKQHIIEALKQTGYNKSRAAQLLGIDRKTLYNKLKLYGIEL